MFTAAHHLDCSAVAALNDHTEEFFYSGDTDIMIIAIIASERSLSLNLLSSRGSF